MKKLLACLLVIVMAVTVFTGCKENKTEKPSDTGSTSDVTTPTPTPTEPTGTGDETTFPTIDPKYVANKKDVIEFKIYDEADVMTRWTKAVKDRLKEEYNLEVSAVSVPRVTVEGVGVYTESSVLLPTADIEASYTEALSLMFMQPETFPDYMPSLYGTVTGCPAAKTLGKNYMVNLAPYIEEGRTLQNYLLWLWEDDVEYFEKAKDALMTSDDAIYALPRREMMAINKFLAYNKSIFDLSSTSWDKQPETWDEFISLLTMVKNDTERFKDIVPFIMAEARLENLLGFIASTYGLDFNVDFEWTEKNGEPLWTYFWADYLGILEKARMMGEEGLTMTDKDNPKFVVHYNLDDNAKGRQAWARESGWQRQGEVGNAIAIYATSAVIAQFGSSGNSTGQSDWRLADKWVTQEGREYSLIGGTQFAQSYIAIGNRIDKERGDNEFTLRILELINYSMTDYGYKEYFFGREGIPFGENVKECGAWVWDINPITGERAVRFSIEDRLDFNADNDETLLKYLNEHKGKDDPEIKKYTRPDGKTDKEFWISLNPNYQIFLEEARGKWRNAYDEKAAPDVRQSKDDGVGVDYRDYAKVQFTQPLYRSIANYKFGTIMYGDVTSYPMQMTVYWDYMEAMSTHAAVIDAHKEKNKQTNSFIYKGFYKDASFLGTTEASKLQQKMDNLKAIAKDFTIGFLSNQRQTSDWSNYINSLREAGYQDVYDFYNGGGRIATVTTYNENTISQSKVEQYRGK